MDKNCIGTELVSKSFQKCVIPDTLHGSEDDEVWGENSGTCSDSDVNDDDSNVEANNREDCK